MLVLKRKNGETVMIGDEIEVHVLGVEGDYVKLGFVAPKNVQIMRKELHESIMQENTFAVETTKGANENQAIHRIEMLKKFKK
ncbi:carbon storage regulator CsrA [Paenibacillus popilliae]|uniref:Translational regulator CsrA n=1 Tax=Paenibacillus popilliae ATCC 14706 TaxID=1212764 RepID=M9LYS5_PAEPP|nr:carbon storage regulator CsrA [Paenibacillus popilliae]GAC41324.1 carbon storage regulator [Paenibacillus popilliae ATCC 14706]